MSRKIAIMQPYFFPYIGYFQLIQAVDVFIVYDNIKYTKKGWFNRNRMLQNNKDVLFSLPLKHDKDHLHVREREISKDFDRAHLLNQFKNNYRRAPYFDETYPLIERCVNFPNLNLFQFVHHSLAQICQYLHIQTEIKISSEVNIDHNLTSQQKVISLCEALAGDTYINAIGGTELYDQSEFQKKGISLKFIRTKPIEYKQFENQFIPWLSIIDVMMFNPVEKIYDWLNSQYDLINRNENETV